MASFYSHPQQLASSAGFKRCAGYLHLAVPLFEPDQAGYKHAETSQFWLDILQHPTPVENLSLNERVAGIFQ
jgi:hypothetical protein